MGSRSPRSRTGRDTSEEGDVGTVPTSVPTGRPLTSRFSHRLTAWRRRYGLLSESWLHCKNIRIFTDILWRVFHILTQPVPYTSVSVNRRNNEARDHVCTVYLHAKADLDRRMLWSRTLARKTSTAWKNVEFCTSTVSNGSHFALSRHLLILLGSIRVWENRLVKAVQETASDETWKRTATWSQCSWLTSITRYVAARWWSNDKNSRYTKTERERERESWSGVQPPAAAATASLALTTCTLVSTASERPCRDAS